jgi:hypothetical protein
MRTGGAGGRADAVGAGADGVCGPVVKGMARATELLVLDEVEALFCAGLHPAKAAQAANSAAPETDKRNEERGMGDSLSFTYLRIFMLNTM